MMVTCTDLAVLCGTYPEACYAKYGSYCLKGKYCHEAALRIVLSCMEGHANRHRRYIVPLVSVHINFYVRPTSVTPPLHSLHSLQPSVSINSPSHHHALS